MTETGTSPLDRSHIPHACGVYIMRDASGEILYIGKAKDLAKRVANYFNPSKGDGKTSALSPLIRKIDYIPCASEREALVLERRLVRQYQPFFNVELKDDKSYPFVRVTLGEDFPRVLLTRKRLRDGSVYFGPFPKVTPVRRLLNYLWRHKYFPLRPCGYEFRVDKPLDPKKINACLYYHTAECPAPCAGKITREDYRRYAEDVILFFRGQYHELRRRFEAEMKEASRRLEYERAAQLRDNIDAITQMGQRVRVQAVREEAVARPIAASQSVTDLQQALGLAKPPFHIECFDISHFQGRQTVAAMVCFKGGEPHKDHYRRFRVRETGRKGSAASRPVPGANIAPGTQGIDDFKSMAEVVRRRYVRLAADKEALPDLVLIDGGKGQLAAAVSALKAAGARVPVASLAKRLEEVFVPGRADSFVLDPARPALRLLQRVRDEAHRFAVKYHTLLRGKALLG